MAKLLNIEDILRNNSYPGRGIILGRTENNRATMMVYFIMGRSENSRNRIFVETPDDGIRTQAFDPEKLVDPSLIIYHPVRTANRYNIVTNGSQTDTISEYILDGKRYTDAIMSHTFEPDVPNYTPRISGIVSPNGNYSMSIIKSAGGDPSSCRRYFFEYENPIAGQGHFIHTYKCDGDPIPSFEGEPVQIAISGNLKEFAYRVWNALNSENKVSLFARTVSVMDGWTESLIINKNS